MASKKSKIIIALIALILLAASGSVLAMYLQHCKQELREVDRYAQPYIIQVMEALSTWQYATIEPLLTDQYKAVFSPEEWQKELQQLSVLGELRSFGRPQFVKYATFKKYWVCESAIDVYSVSTEYEHANAVVVFQFLNECGKLSVNTFKVTSSILKQTPDYLEDSSTIDEISVDEDVTTDPSTSDSNLEENNIEQSKSVAPKKSTKPRKPKGAIYRY